MQILPTDALDFSDTIRSAAAVVDTAVQGTAEGFGAVLSSVQNSMNTHEDSVAQDFSAPEKILAPAPYNDTANSNPLDTLLSRKELGELRDRLIKGGVRPDQLTNFDKLSGQPFGASLQQVLGSLKLSEENMQFSEEGKARIKGLLQRIGTGENAATDIMAMLQSGQSLQAFTTLMNTLPQGRIQLDADDMALLGKALKLDDAGMDMLLKNTRGRSEFGGDELKSILSAVQKALEQRSEDQKNLGKAVESSLPLMLQKALERIKSERDQAQGADKKISQSQILITDTVTRATTTQLLDPRLNADTEKSSALQNAQANKNAGKPNTSEKPDAKLLEDAHAAPVQGIVLPKEKGEQSGQGNTQERHGRDAHDKPKTAEEAMAVTAQNTHNQEKNAARLERQDIWNTLTGQISLGQTPSSVEMPSPQASTLPPSNRAVLAQVEQGMLSAMKDGTQRLELQLNPLELGALTVVLTSRNGEVSAILRPDKAETGEIIHQQLDSLRFAMEQQGIKVDKVEVQSQLYESRDQQMWQGTDQHNKSMQEDAQQKELEQFRRLGKMRNLADSPLMQMAHDMHSIQQTAEISGVHLIA